LQISSVGLPLFVVATTTVVASIVTVVVAAAVAVRLVVRVESSPIFRPILRRLLVRTPALRRRKLCAGNIVRRGRGPAGGRQSGDVRRNTYEHIHVSVRDAERQHLVAVEHCQITNTPHASPLQYGQMLGDSRLHERFRKAHGQP
jgi:hypothetical protein